LPYCPPETFNRIKKFTSKSDVFTVGMILYRVLFNDFPFFPTSELKEGYAGREYLSKWMLAPERVE
jgi:serine/threonine protein kinase